MCSDWIDLITCLTRFFDEETRKIPTVCAARTAPSVGYTSWPLWAHKVRKPNPQDSVPPFHPLTACLTHLRNFDGENRKGFQSNLWSWGRGSSRSWRGCLTGWLCWLGLIRVHPETLKNFWSIFLTLCVVKENCKIPILSQSLTSHVVNESGF